ncbi:hypothetical protein YC2023_025833 [Brassica napus]
MYTVHIIREECEVENNKDDGCISNGTKLRVADFVHGKDGLGNQNFPPPEEIVSEAFTDLSSRYLPHLYLSLLEPVLQDLVYVRTEPGVAKSGWCLLLRTYASQLHDLEPEEKEKKQHVVAAHTFLLEYNEAEAEST